MHPQTQIEEATQLNCHGLCREFPVFGLSVVGKDRGGSHLDANFSDVSLKCARICRKMTKFEKVF